MGRSRLPPSSTNRRACSASGARSATDCGQRAPSGSSRNCGRVRRRRARSPRWTQADHASGTLRWTRMTRDGAGLLSPTGGRRSPSSSSRRRRPRTSGCSGRRSASWSRCGRRSCRSPTAPAARPATHTIEITERIATDTTLLPVAHLTAVNHSVAELRAIIGRLADAGIATCSRCAATRRATRRASGSSTPRAWRTPRTWSSWCAAHGDFCVGVAAFPYKHPRSLSVEDDTAHFVAKCRAGADYAITQMFFDADDYLRLRDRVAAAGCDVPIIAGLMPVTKMGTIERSEQLSGAPFPAGAGGAVRRGRRRPEGGPRARHRRGDRAGRAAARRGRAGHPLHHAQPSQGDPRGDGGTCRCPAGRLNAQSVEAHRARRTAAARRAPRTAGRRRGTGSGGPGRRSRARGTAANARVSASGVESSIDRCGRPSASERAARARCRWPCQSGRTCSSDSSKASLSQSVGCRGIERPAHQVVPPLAGQGGVAVAEPDQRAVCRQRRPAREPGVCRRAGARSPPAAGPPRAGSPSLGRRSPSRRRRAAAKSAGSHTRKSSTGPPAGRRRYAGMLGQRAHATSPASHR